MSEPMLHVRQVKSSIGSKPKHKGALRALGLGRIGKEHTLPDRPEIRGQIARVPHLIVVQEVDGAAAKAKATKAPAKKKAVAKTADPVAAALATDKAVAEKAPAKKAAAKKAPAKAAAAKKTAAKKAPAKKAAAKKASE